MSVIFRVIATIWCLAVFILGFGIVRQLMTVDGLDPLNNASGLTVAFVVIWLVSSALLSFLGVILLLILHRMIEG